MPGPHGLGIRRSYGGPVPPTGCAVSTRHSTSGSASGDQERRVRTLEPGDGDLDLRHGTGHRFELLIDLREPLVQNFTPPPAGEEQSEPQHLGDPHDRSALLFGRREIDLRADAPVVVAGGVVDRLLDAPVAFGGSGLVDLHQRGGS